MRPPSAGRPAVRFDGLRYLRNYGLGMALVAAVVSLLGYSVALGAPGFAAGPSALCLASYLVAVGSVIRRTWLDRQWRPVTAAVWMVAITAFTAAVRIPLDAEQLTGPADWVFGAYGYVAVVVLAGRRLRYTVAALTITWSSGSPRCWSRPRSTGRCCSHWPRPPSG